MESEYLSFKPFYTRYTSIRTILSHGCKSTEVVLTILKAQISNDVCFNLGGASKEYTAARATGTVTQKHRESFSKNPFITPVCLLNKPKNKQKPTWCSSK